MPEIQLKELTPLMQGRRSKCQVNIEAEGNNNDIGNESKPHPTHPIKVQVEPKQAKDRREKDLT